MLPLACDLLFCDFKTMNIIVIFIIIIGSSSGSSSNWNQSNHLELLANASLASKVYPWTDDVARVLTPSWSVSTAECRKVFALKPQMWLRVPVYKIS